jgi:hypothetical protein
MVEALGGQARPKPNGCQMIHDDEDNVEEKSERDEDQSDVDDGIQAAPKKKAVARAKRKPRKASPPDEELTIVEHPKFGRGKITARKGTGDRIMWDVEFDTGDARTMMASYLTILGA